MGFLFRHYSHVNEKKECQTYIEFHLNEIKYSVFLLLHVKLKKERDNLRISWWKVTYHKVYAFIKKLILKYNMFAFELIW